MEGEGQEEMGREKKWKERDKRRWEERRNGRRSEEATEHVYD